VLQAAAVAVVGTRIGNGDNHCQFSTSSRSSRPSVPRYWSASKVIASPKPSLKRIVHGRNGRTRKRNAGQLRQGLAARRVAPPCRPSASLPCFPFFPWSNRVPSCPVAGRGQTPARRGGRHTRPRKLPSFEHLTQSREAAKGNAKILSRSERRR
jgi:hypothetical protein